MRNNGSKRTAFYYCGMEVLGSILEKHQIWLSDLRKMNDPKELVWAKDCAMSALEDDKASSDALRRIVSSGLEIGTSGRPLYFASCFSKDCDLVSQWREYADRGRGVAIEFDLDALAKVNSDFLSIESIRYVQPPSDGATPSWLNFARCYSDELRVTMANAILGTDCDDLACKEDYHDLVVHGKSTADCLLTIEQNFAALCCDIAEELTSGSKGPFNSSRSVTAAIDEALPYLWDGEYKRAADLICSGLDSTSIDRMEQMLCRQFGRISHFLMSGYHSSDSVKAAKTGYEQLVNGGELGFEDPDGCCSLCFELTHCDEDRMLQLSEEHPELFREAATVQNSHFLAGFKGPGYESEKECRLVLETGEAFDWMLDTNTGVRETFEHDVQLCGDGAVERYKMRFPSEAIVGLVVGPNCKLTYQELFSFMETKDQIYPGLNKNTFTKSVNAMKS